MDIALDEVLHFDAVTSRFDTGAATDADSTPSWAIYEEDTDTAVQSGNFTKRTSLTGNYRASVTLSSANGFEAGKWYNVIGSATVNSVAGKGVVMRFRVVPAESSAGVPKVDVSHFGGSAGTFSSGRAEVNATHLAGTAYASADFSTTMKASINTEADTALTDYGALKPTTAGRTLDVSAGGEAGIDWANVGSPTTALNLSGTTISTSQAVASVSGAVGSVTGAVGSVTGNVGGNVVGSVASVTGNVGGNVTGSVGSVVGAVGSISGVSFPSNFSTLAITVGGAVTAGTVSDKTGYSLSQAFPSNFSSLAITVGGAVTAGTVSDKTGYSLSTAPPTASAIADAVWDETLADHLTGGSTGSGLNAAGSAGDPWSTALPGAYSAGSAGYILGTNLNATVSSRLSSASYSAPPSAATIASAVWDEDIVSGHQTVNMAGWSLTHIHGAIDVLNTYITAAPPTASAIADAVWDEATSGHATAGTTGKALTDTLADTNELQTDWVNGGRLDLILDSRASQASVDDIPTNAELATALAAADDATLAAIAALSIPTTSAIADAVCDEALSGHTTAGTLAKAIADILADTGTDGVVLSAATCNKIADHVRRRTQQNVEASSDGDALSLLSLYGLIQQIQEANTTETAGKLTVKRTDGTTTLGTRDLATDPDAEPVTGVS